MRNYFLVTLAYLAFALIVAALVAEAPLAALGAAGGAMQELAELLLIPVSVLFCIATLRALLWPVPQARQRLLDFWLAAASLLPLHVGFATLKTLLPGMVPFYADPALAQVDAWLHGGTDAWVLVHAWGRGLPVALVEQIYLLGWSFVAVLFPLMLAASDDDKDRRRRFLTLYLASWIVLGNLLALAGSSAGPVFYDQLLGAARFMALGPTLLESGIADSQIGAIQDYMWWNYLNGAQQPSAAISAFPSLHVAIATLFALYLAERSRWLAPIGAAFLLAILFMSAFTGYHYAIDGYVSIAFVGLVWLAQRQGAASAVLLAAKALTRLPALLSRGNFAALRLRRSVR
ncbi:MAG: phosphatase PAP2 family protein [Phaeovulum sp.]|uniref:phosphatase PAP2 family protein n=1 Tax=Phaeovulum sp. TaxID=2934796 RepID=UPI0027313A4C|nr:phosphatase PAP2 family protein [Phaeovulum sp.]MDP2063126.1 phosphatase PAP2 family protein [Phaeovulum sp.]